MPVTRLHNQRFWMTYVWTFVDEAKSGGLAWPASTLDDARTRIVGNIDVSTRDDGETFLFCNQRSLETQTSGLGSGSGVADGQNVITSMTPICVSVFCRPCRALTR